MIIVYIFEDIILIMKKRFDKLFISSLITVSVIILLIVAGPAQAFILQLSIPDKDVTKGENITFIASTTIEDQEVLNISNFIVGIYKTLFLMFFDNQNFTQKGDKIIIRGKVDPDGSCSVRGNNGDITVNQTAFDKNNKINFYIPLN